MRQPVPAFSTADLVKAAAGISEPYRRGLPPQPDTASKRAAYVAARLPAAYAGLSRAAAELPFEPGSWLDLGAGPGAAAWVAPCPATVMREHARAAAGRVLRHPKVRQRLIRLTLCTPAGIGQRSVTRRDPLWRRARKASWGDPWPEAAGGTGGAGNLGEE